jgi:hypothetical protein
MSWRDRANVGFFKQQRIKSLSDQLQNCKMTVNAVVSIATLYVESHTEPYQVMKKLIDCHVDIVPFATPISRKRSREP